MQELLAIQQNGPKAIGFFGTRNMGFLHQQLIEILSYAMVLTSNHIYTSGATGTNAAVRRPRCAAQQRSVTAATKGLAAAARVQSSRMSGTTVRGGRWPCDACPGCAASMRTGGLSSPSPRRRSSALNRARVGCHRCAMLVRDASRGMRCACTTHRCSNETHPRQATSGR